MAATALVTLASAFDAGCDRAGREDGEPDPQDDAGPWDGGHDGPDSESPELDAGDDSAADDGEAVVDGSDDGSGEDAGDASDDASGEPGESYPWRVGSCTWWTQNPPATSYLDLESRGAETWLMASNFAVARNGGGDWRMRITPDEVESLGPLLELEFALEGRLFVRSTSAIWEKVDGTWVKRLDHTSVPLVWGAKLMEGTSTGLFAAGANNSVHVFDGEHWQILLDSSSENILDLWWDGSRLYVARESGGLQESGGLLVYDNARWTTIETQTYFPTFNRVAGTAELGTFALAGGTLFRITGNTASQVDTPDCPNGAVRRITDLRARAGRLVALGEDCEYRRMEFFERGATGWTLLAGVPDYDVSDFELREDGHVLIVRAMGLLQEWTGTRFQDVPPTATAPPAGLLAPQAPGPIYTANDTSPIATSLEPGISRIEAEGFVGLPGTEDVLAERLAYDGSSLYVIASNKLSRYDAATSTLVELLSFEPGSYGYGLAASPAHVYVAWKTFGSTATHVRRRDGAAWMSLPDLAPCSSVTLYSAGADQLLADCGGDVGYQFVGDAWQPLDLMREYGSPLQQLGPATSPVVLRRSSATQHYVHDGSSITTLVLPALPSGVVAQTIAGSVDDYVAVLRRGFGGSKLFASSDGKSPWRIVDGGWPSKLFQDPDPRTARQPTVYASPDVLVLSLRSPATVVRCDLSQ